MKYRNFLDYLQMKNYMSFYEIPEFYILRSVKQSQSTHLH